MASPKDDRSVPKSAESWQWSGPSLHEQLTQAASGRDALHSNGQITLTSHIVRQRDSPSRTIIYRGSAPATPGQLNSLSVHIRQCDSGPVFGASASREVNTTNNKDTGPRSPHSDSNPKRPGHETMVATRSGRTPKATPKAPKNTPKKHTAVKKRPAYEGASEDELALMSTPKAARGNNTSPTPAVRPIPKSWQSPAIITSSRSPLTRIDLTSLLQHDAAWSVLGADAQLRLLTMLGIKDPEMGAAGKYKNYAAALFEEDEALRNDVMRFEDHLRAGRLDPEWLAEAEEASEMRAKGDLDSEGEGDEP